MGLAVRIIPTLLKRGRNLVKGRQFKPDRVVGHLLQACRIHQSRGVDELCILDVGLDVDPPDYEVIRDITTDCFMPLTVGGGVRNAYHVERLLVAGADKVAVCSGAFHAKGVAHSKLPNWTRQFGSQAIVACLNVSDRFVRHGFWRSAEACGMAQQLVDEGHVGEILLTSVDREGTMEGYDFELIRAVSHAVGVPVIAHGGCSGPEDMLHAIEAGASAVAAGALFQFTECTPRGAAEYLCAKGIEARI